MTTWNNPKYHGIRSRGAKIQSFVSFDRLMSDIEKNVGLKSNEIVESLEVTPDGINVIITYKK